MIRLRLKELMEERGISQRDLSQITGIRQATISDMSRNARDAINRAHLEKIMKALSIKSFDDILEFTNEEK